MRCFLMLEIKRGGGSEEKRFESCLGFSFEKALYVPYTKFSGVFYVDGKPDFSAGDVLSVRAALDGSDIHFGMPDRVTVEEYGYGYRMKVTSRGYTLLLAQNQPYPKVNINVTLKGLCTGNLGCDRISYEDPTPMVDSIYVNEGSNVWEAAVAYCMKASGNYPYIKGDNKVMMTTELSGEIAYNDCVVTAAATYMDSSMILSDVYMKELGDDYPFEAHDSSAEDMGIIRSRYYPLDMQWLYAPQRGLQHKLDYSNRGIRVSGITYEGWKREDLMDRAFGVEHIDGKRINFIRVTGGRKGVFTAIRVYDDRYGQR